jgi:hypothetical protein
VLRHTLARNQWGVAVRFIAPEAFKQICSLGFQNLGVDPLELREPPGLPSMDDVHPHVGDQRSPLLIERQNKTIGRGGDFVPFRRSKFSKLTGDRAEAIVLKHLQSSLPGHEARTVGWVADKNLGWDIQFRDSKERLIAVEVKGTVGEPFVDIDLTSNEWNAAQKLRERYFLCIVARALTKSPVIQDIQNPAGCEESGSLAVTPTAFRLQRIVGGK